MRSLIVNARSERYVIFGTPIEHSMSPIIMNGQFDRLNMDKVFLAVDTGLETFDQIMAAARLMDFRGYVFTMPVKEASVKFMDELSPEAAIIGAVNCGKCDKGYHIGYNTDSIGFWNAVRDKAPSALIEKVLVLGAGGFSRSAVAQLAIQGVPEVVVSNMLSATAFVSSFNAFLQRLNAAYPKTKVRLIDWDPALWAKELPTCHVVANGTPNGMGDVGDLHSLFPYASAKPETIFFDAIYKPRITRFLNKAGSLGFTTVEGFDLLVHQGVCAFYHWTGVRVDAASMKQDILDFMKNKA